MSEIASTDRGKRRAYLVGLLGGEPHGCGLLAADHEVDVVLGPQTVRHRAQEAVGIRGEVDASELGLEVEDGADEAGVLVREPVVLLPRPGGGLDVVERAARLAPCRLVCLYARFCEWKSTTECP